MNDLIKKIKKQDKNLLISLISSLPTFTIWLLATFSFLYINYIGPMVFDLSEFYEFIIYILMPFLGLIFAILAHRKNKSKLTHSLIIINLILLGLVITAAFLQTS